MDKITRADAVIEEAESAAYHQFSARKRLPCKPESRSQVVIGNPIVGRVVAAHDGYTSGWLAVVRNKILRHYIADEAGTRGLRRCGRSGNRLQQARPDVGQVAVLVAQHAII